MENKDIKENKDKSQFGAGSNSTDTRQAGAGKEPLKDAKNSTSSRRDSSDDEDEVGGERARPNQNQHAGNEKAKQAPGNQR
jgi:hypothetical protein